MDQPQADTPQVITQRARTAKIGLVLFAIYSIGYLLFMLLNVIDAKGMGEALLGGLNRAIVIGMILIVGAILLSIFYLFLCRTPAVASTESSSSKGDRS